MNCFYKNNERDGGEPLRGAFRALSLVVLSAAAILVASCRAVPLKEEIPEDLSIHELSLRGQNELDRNNYAAAEVYYEVIIDRYGGDMRTVTAAEYEIAHIRIKQRRWGDARPILERIIARYESAGGAGLPPEYLVLARNDLRRAIEGESSAASSDGDEAAAE